MTDRKRLDRHLDPGAAGSPVRLLPGLSGSPGHVQVIIGDADATTGRGQLLTWAVVNLLLRCYEVLDSVTVTCPDVLLAAALPRVSSGTEPRTLHEALSSLATATAEPGGAGPRLAVRTGSPVPRVKAGAATLIVGTEYARPLAEAVSAGPTWLVAAGAWKLVIASPAAISSGLAAGLPRLGEAGTVSVAVWLAAALACGEVFKHIGQIREGKGRLIEAFSVNLWTLSGSDGFAELTGPDGPARPPRLPAHYVVGAGAVAEAYLAVLASSDVTTAVALLDDDILGDTNLNRHILAGWADIGEPKALLARDRLAGSRTEIFPVNVRWDAYLAVPPAERPARPAGIAADEAAGRYRLVISAVDRNDSRISIAAARPQVILGGSTNGLQAEVGRYRAGSGWQCLACGTFPEPLPSIEQAAAGLARPHAGRPRSRRPRAEPRPGRAARLPPPPRMRDTRRTGSPPVRGIQPAGLVSVLRFCRLRRAARRARPHPCRPRRRDADPGRRRHHPAVDGRSRDQPDRPPSLPPLPRLRDFRHRDSRLAAAARTAGRRVFRPRPGGP